ncbi:hypothetical protein GZH53_15775 [Flavihumibacter sp. R14]|nr:hypothetical protein [Flavihumibacter soli]
MEIDLNNPGEFTLESLAELIASEDDSKDTQFRVTKSGILYLSKEVGNTNLEDTAFRLETNGAGNDYVGEEASKDLEWVTRVYNVISKNWPNPKTPYSDDF